MAHVIQTECSEEGRGNEGGGNGPHDSWSMKREADRCPGSLSVDGKKES